MTSLIRWFIVAALLFVAAPAHSQCTWQTVHTDQPRLPFTTNVGMNMVYDAGRSSCLLYGSSLYRWDGSLWRMESPVNAAQPGGTPGGPGAMAYDTTRSLVMLLKGADLWSYDGSRWVKRTVGGIPTRINAAMVYDSARDRLVVFGGGGGPNGYPNLGDTWEWDGSVWTQRASTGPAARNFHNMVYDSVRGRVVLFGGLSDYPWTPFGDTWEWDGSAWSQRQAAGGPPARERAFMAFDSSRGRTVLFGGNPYNNYLELADTWEWDGSSWTLTGAAGPQPRAGGIMAYDASRHRTVLYGGTRRSNTVTYFDTWEWDGGTWRQVAPTDPSPRSGHTLVYDPDHGATVLFGGDATDAATWTFAGSSWTRLPASGPSARAGHAAVYDNARHQLVLFGGNTGYPSYTDLQDTWVFDGSTWTQRTVAGPAARSRFALAYDPQRQRVVLFGGQVGSGASPTYFADTWEWDGQAWTQSPAQGPSARAGHMMTYDAHLGRVVLVGGYSYDGMMDTWEWDGSAWTQGAPLDVDIYYGRYDGAIAFDPIRQRTVLFGGSPQSTSSYYMCEYDGSSWTRGVRNSISRVGAPMVYEPAASRFLLFGGDGPYGDTLDLPSDLTPPVVTTQPVAQTIHNGDTVSFTAAATGVGPLTYQWWHGANPVGVVNGPGGASANLPGGGVVSGATSPTFTITRATPSDVPYGGTYYCAVSNGCTTVNTASVQLVVLPCGSADFDHDGMPGTDADIDAFFACLGGNCCSTCGYADFNGDRDTGTDADIDAFFRVLAGGSC